MSKYIFLKDLTGKEVDSIDFGYQEEGSSTVREFVISNEGKGFFLLPTINIEGPAAEWTKIPYIPTLEPGQKHSFFIELTVPAGADPGRINCKIIIKGKYKIEDSEFRNGG